MPFLNRYRREPPPGHPGGVRWNYDGPITYNSGKGLYEDCSGETSFSELRARFQPAAGPRSPLEHLLDSVSHISTSLLTRARHDTPDTGARNLPRHDL